MIHIIVKSLKLKKISNKININYTNKKLIISKTYKNKEREIRDLVSKILTTCWQIDNKIKLAVNLSTLLYIIFGYSRS